jgi:hypothetical protein
MGYSCTTYICSLGINSGIVLLLSSSVGTELLSDITCDCGERTSPSWTGIEEAIIARLNLFALLLSHSAQSIDPMAMTPNGTPSPTPIVVSCELLVDAGAGIDEFDELDDNDESGVTRFARAARPVRTWASASRKLSVSSRQTVSLPLATGVPQQYLELPLMVCRVTIAEPSLLFTVPGSATY